jgi:hypothetical protein
MTFIEHDKAAEKARFAEPLHFYAIVDENNEIDFESLSHLKRDCRLTKGDRQAGCRVAEVQLIETAAVCDVETVARSIEVAVRCTLQLRGEDPDEPISDAGHTVFDGVIHQIRAALDKARAGK